MVLMSKPEHLINLFKRAGFGERTEIGYPGEMDGTIVNTTHMSSFVLATLGFGYGLSVTTIELAKAYTIFANHGKLKSISLLHNQPTAPDRAVISPYVAKQVLLMMEAVLSNEGTGKLARVAGYRVAGKTGTARIAQSHGYAENRHIASFVGIARGSNS